jgi:hypothetical protein
MLAFGNLRGGLGPATSAGRAGDEKLYILLNAMAYDGGDVSRCFGRLEPLGAVRIVRGAVRILESDDGGDDSITRFRFLGVGVLVSRVDKGGRLWRGIE